MRVNQLSWSEAGGWTAVPAERRNADLVFLFGGRSALACGARYHELRAMFPDAHILGCSTGGQIRNDDITDDEIAAAAIGFDATSLRLACEPAPSPENSRCVRGRDWPGFGGARSCWNFCSVGWLECQRQRARCRNYRRGRRSGLGHWRTGRRWRRISGNAGGCRLRSAQADGRGGRLLRTGGSHRPRQRRRLGRVRTTPANYPVARQYFIRARRRPGARSLRALSRATTPRACPAARFCFRCAFSIASGPTMTSSERSLPSTTRRAP